MNHLPRFCALILLPVAFLLSGCFVSGQPKFPLAGAAALFGEGGRYGVYEHLTDGSYKRQEAFVIKLAPDRSYQFTNEKGETLTMSLHPLSDDVFVGQAKEKNKPDLSYVVFRVTGNEAILFAPQCSDQDKAVFSSLGVRMNDQFECSIEQVSDPAALFKRLDLGMPVSKLVRE